MEAVNQNVQLSATISQIPFHIDEWLFAKINGNKEKLEALVQSGEVGLGHHSMGNGSAIDDRCFKVYTSEDRSKIYLYWNNGIQISFCHVSLEYTNRTGRYDDEYYYGGCC